MSKNETPAFIKAHTQCITINDNRAVISLREKRSEYKALNPEKKHVIVLVVDDCILSDKDGIKCDYLILVEDTAHFIELKGKDLNHAIDQIFESVKKVMPELQGEFPAAHAKISISGTPKIFDIKRWERLKALMKRYKGGAYKSNTPFEDTF